jgi:phage baseplate assembly protein W
MARDFVYSDLDIEFTRASDGDVTKDKDTTAILNSLSNIASTLQGSRRMLPEFAQDLWGLLFEPMDTETARAIGSQILEAVRTWENRVDVTAINIVPDYDNNIYKISMTFTIKPLRVEETIDFVLFSQ